MHHNYLKKHNCTFLTGTQQNDFGSAQNGRQIYTAYTI